MNRLVLVFLLMTICASCRKDPGFGGLATIKGKVYAYDYTNSGNLDAEGYAPDIAVYIGIQGVDGVLDKVDTDYNGAYSFDKLRKGNYLIWVFTECDTCTGNIKPIVQSINVSSDKAVVSLPDFKINI